VNNKIQIFDDVLPFWLRDRIYWWAFKSRYQIGWADSIDPMKSANKDMHAMFTDDEFKELGLWEYLQQHPTMAPVIQPYKPVKIVINLTRSCDVHFTHIHPEKKVLLYYINPEWKEGWEGETFFFTENNQEIDTVLSYVPGRFILFDGTQPHTIRAQSIIGPQFRFTLAIALD
jgi:hypothetical protein